MVAGELLEKMVFQAGTSTGYDALESPRKRKKEAAGNEGKDRRGVKVAGSGRQQQQQQLPRTIINHQERDNRIAQPTGEQLSLR